MNHTELKSRRVALGLTQEFVGLHIHHTIAQIRLFEGGKGGAGNKVDAAAYEKFICGIHPVETVIAGYTAYPHCVQCNRWKIATGSVTFNYHAYVRHTCADCGCVEYRLRDMRSGVRATHYRRRG